MNYPMVEVFKTNVPRPEKANVLLLELHQMFSHYRANFDMQDCDKILRIECKTQTVDAKAIVTFMQNSGFYAEILEDETADEIALLMKTTSSGS
jgi:hypothetical protein